MALNKLLITPKHRSTLYGSMIPAILEVLYHELQYEISNSLLDRYIGCMDHVATAERKHIMDSLLYRIDDAATGLGITKIHEVVSIHNVHYCIYWS